MKNNLVLFHKVDHVNSIVLGKIKDCGMIDRSFFIQIYLFRKSFQSTDNHLN